MEIVIIFWGYKTEVNNKEGGGHDNEFQYYGVGGRGEWWGFVLLEELGEFVYFPQYNF